MSGRERRNKAAGRPRLEESREMTDRIVESATELFLERGYSAASMDELALRCGVGKQAIYNRFPTKGDLFVKVYNQQIGRVFASIPRLDGDMTELERIRSACLAMTISMLDPSVVMLCRIAYGESVRFPDLGDQVRRKSIAEFVEPVSALVRSAQESGLLSPGDPEALSHIIMVGCYAFPFMEALLGDTSMREVSARQSYFESVWPTVIGAHRTSGGQRSLMGNRA